MSILIHLSQFFVTVENILALRYFRIIQFYTDKSLKIDIYFRFYHKLYTSRELEFAHNNFGAELFFAP